MNTTELLGSALTKQIPDGIKEIQDEIPAIIKIIERTTRWVDPETFKRLPVWHPHTSRGRALYDSSWTRPSTNTKKATGVKADKFEGNVSALKSLILALGVTSPKPKNWTVCHIWGYDDPTFALQSSIVKDPRYFTCVANMVWLPTPLKGFTDAVPDIKNILRVCSYYLYGWVCEHESVTADANKIRSGWIPDSYPNSWPSPSNPKLLPAGVATFSDLIDQRIRKQKYEIKKSLNNLDFLHYPRDEVQQVLNFWKINLET